jgi:hypothetical protein
VTGRLQKQILAGTIDLEYQNQIAAEYEDGLISNTGAGYATAVQTYNQALNDAANSRALWMSVAATVMGTVFAGVVEPILKGAFISANTRAGAAA